MKSIFDNWNIQTQLWLRRIAYDRLPTGKTLGVFVLSAFWHGFYPGYYMTFVLAAFYVYAGRGVIKIYFNSISMNNIQSLSNEINFEFLDSTKDSTTFPKK